MKVKYSGPPNIGRVSITAPLPLLGLGHHARPHRIENHITTQFQQVVCLFNKNRLVTALKDMADSLVDAIERLRVDAV